VSEEQGRRNLRMPNNDEAVRRGDGTQRRQPRTRPLRRRREPNGPYPRPYEVPNVDQRGRRRPSSNPGTGRTRRPTSSGVTLARTQSSCAKKATSTDFSDCETRRERERAIVSSLSDRRVTTSFRRFPVNRFSTAAVTGLAGNVGLLAGYVPAVGIRRDFRLPSCVLHTVGSSPHGDGDRRPVRVRPAAGRIFSP